MLQARQIILIIYIISDFMPNSVLVQTHKDIGEGLLSIQSYISWIKAFTSENWSSLS